jgi:hypothetical protein
MEGWHGEPSSAIIQPDPPAFPTGGTSSCHKDNRAVNRSIIAALATALATTPAIAQEVGSATVVPIQVTGDPAARFSLVILGDGYAAAEQSRFREHVDKHLNVLWSIEPFRSYRNYINVYAVEIVSGVSGITCDPAHRETRATPLSMRFGGGCENANARGINVDQEAARGYAAMATPDYDQILSIANTDTYGGIGGRTATTSGGNSLGPLITPHELGHSLGRLQDEYTYSARGRAGGVHDGDEPNSAHHTVMTEEQMRAQQTKWWRWLGEESLSGGMIGRFQGGQGDTAGIWRPSKHSMMISLGYAFDQVSRERMTDRISAQVELIAASSPTDRPVSPRDVIWIETAQPVYHDLDVTWRVDGNPVVSANGLRNLALAPLNLGAGEHIVEVAVVDPTEFVRDPAIRDSSLTATRRWTVVENALPPSFAPPAITASTQTTRPVGGTDVVYIQTTHPTGRVHTVAWRLDGNVVENGNRRSFQLARQNLSPGTHALSATVTDPADPAAPADTRTWTVDNTAPTVRHTLSSTVATVDAPGGSRHYFMRDEFTMLLVPQDDQPGYVVAEFRVNGDGWHHYYGWPDAPAGSPFRFTPRGANIKELVYGSLSSEGLSPQPWEPREPGWGTHHIELRAIDAAGNIANAGDFHVTFAPTLPCTNRITSAHAGPLSITSGVTCIENATVNGTVTVGAGASLVATNATISTLTAERARDVQLLHTNVQGATQIAGTTGSVTLWLSQFADRLELTDNTAPVTVTLSDVADLACTGNTREPGVVANSILQVGGQCAVPPRSR